MRRLALIPFLLLAPAAGAQEVDCENAMAQVDMTFCAGQEYEVADAALNAAYKQARAAMKAIDADLPEDERGAERSLQEAQRAWIVYRDAACAAEGYLMHGGSAEPMVVYGCLATLARVRTQDLLYLAEPF